jgi:hypothetical protein
MCVFGRVLSFPPQGVVDGIWTVVLSSQFTVNTSRCFTFGRVLSFPSKAATDGECCLTPIKRLLRWVLLTVFTGWTKSEGTERVMVCDRTHWGLVGDETHEATALEDSRVSVHII